MVIKYLHHSVNTKERENQLTQMGHSQDCYLWKTQGYQATSELILC
jgi:hypothetical protein